ncbi:hypothetical protein IC582_007623 [Cucumis melo]
MRCLRNTLTKKRWRMIFDGGGHKDDLSTIWDDTMVVARLGLPDLWQVFDGGGHDDKMVVRR